MSALDDLRDQIKFRGERTGGFEDPVKEFKGKLEGFDVAEAVFQGVPQGRNNVVLKFSELEVLVASLPWTFPVKEITIGYSTNKESRWIIFADSGLKFLRDDEEFRDLIGRRVHLKQVTHTIFMGKEKGRQPAGCWEIVGVEGASSNGGGNGHEVGAMSAENQLLLLLNGHTEQQFNMEALRMPSVMANSSLTTQILNHSFFTGLVGRGLVQRDATGIYSLTEAGMKELQGVAK